MSPKRRETPRLTNDEAVQIISEAVIRANADYADMSGGLILHDSGVEAYVSGGIAHALCQAGRDKGGNAYATLETPLEMIAEWSGASGTPGAKPKPLRRKGRVDVVYYDGEEAPAGVIEVKRYFGWSRLRDDADRLAKIIERWGQAKSGSIRWGCVVGFHSEYDGSKKPIAQITSDFCTKFSTQYPEMNLHPFNATAEVPLDSAHREYKLARFHAPAVLFAPAA